MNWGKGIITGMILFMLFIVAMGIYMFTVPVDDYDHQYYEKGMAFNQVYNKEQQVNLDHAWPVVNVSNKMVKVTFIKPAKGNIKFERPSNTGLDKTIPFATLKDLDLNTATSGLSKGKWQVELDWESAGKHYLYHQEITIP